MKRALKIAIPLVVIGIIFFFALPKIADFSKVWREIAAMSWIELVSLTAVALWNLATYWFVMMAALPGSNIWQTMKINQASTAVANTVPGGGALGIGVMYGMYTGYGFSPTAIGLALLVAGIWNNFVKLGMPVIAIALLAVTAEVSGGILIAGIAGVLGLVVAIGLFAAVLSSERLARSVGAWLGRVISFARRLVRKETTRDFGDATVRFRKEAIHLVRQRWLYLTVASVLSHLSLYVVLVLALRHVGVSEAEVGWVEILAAFAFIRLISALPITPGGLGVVELGLTAALVAAGGDRAEVVAAVLVYRALTYLLPIPIGLSMYLRWRRGSEERRQNLEAHASASSATVTSGS